MIKFDFRLMIIERIVMVMIKIIKIGDGDGDYRTFQSSGGAVTGG